MTRFILSAVFCLAVTIGFGQSQGEMNEDAMKQYQKADKELNTVYQKVLTEYKKDVAFIKNFKAAQRLWVQLRDAELKAKYPDRPAGHYGSIQPVCHYSYLATLTEERTAKLKIWLTGVEEGDLCSGSVKVKN